MADLLRSLKGVFPFVCEQAAAEYTTMDVGRTFRHLEGKIREAMAAVAVVKLLPMPERFLQEAMVSWGVVAMHICEDKQTHHEQGGPESIQRALGHSPTAAEAKLIVHTIQLTSPCRRRSPA